MFRCRKTARLICMERWLSWSKAHDWKSCSGLNPDRGSNPLLSAKRKPQYFVYGDYRIQNVVVFSFFICFNRLN